MEKLLVAHPEPTDPGNELKPEELIELAEGVFNLDKKMVPKLTELTHQD